jgi:imidazolonepropionase-like amidohydrolase
MKAIADEAHMLHMKVAAHAHGDEGIHDAILAGIDTIEHASLASDATIKLAAQRRTWFSMDIYNDDYILATGTSNGTEQESLDKEKAIGLKQRQTFQRAVAPACRCCSGPTPGSIRTATTASSSPRWCNGA